ncbi:uncharacterized protein LOC114256053 [Camellia sinensis]|uniref:uncharacterized protein LOC114256053 n=1 Tax=Camellia sinensis TaxID=4442 RepID=UPI0010365558|nr:uncharacterized protein LOC114256053 [Camellia sinensis]
MKHEISENFSYIDNHPGYVYMEEMRNVDESESSDARISRLERMVKALTEPLRQQQQRQIHVPELTNSDMITLTQKYNKMKPLEFMEGIEPLKVEAWVLETENIFEVFPCTEAQKVLLATFTLKEEARRWWMLVHNDNEVAEYKAKFTELAQYAPHMIDIDYKKGRKFEGGLDLDVYDEVGISKLSKYVDILDRVLMSKANITALKISNQHHQLN